MKQIDLKQYGFSDGYEAEAREYPSLSPGRVLSQEKGRYRVVGEQGEGFAQVSGKLRYQAASLSDYPAVGDFVLLEGRPEDGSWVIHHILHRKSIFIRRAAGTAHVEQVVAANIDTVFLCMSLNNDFNLRRMERYLSIAWDSGATPVVVLTKADLCEDVAGKLLAVEAAAMGAEVLVTSAIEEPLIAAATAKDGYRHILSRIKDGQTVALLGSSGVGKSTLINRLLGEERLDTNGLRNDDKGRHTTTHRELLLLPGGGMVIDTPGMRELGIWDAAGGLDKAFSDIEALAAGCRFRNCTHKNEPGCGIRAALAQGELSEERWLSYQKLKAESAYAEDSESYLATKERKFKEIAKINKGNKKR